MSLKWCAKTWKIGYKLGSRLIFDEHAVTVMSARKQMGKDEEDRIGGSYLYFGTLKPVAWPDWFDWV